MISIIFCGITLEYSRNTGYNQAEVVFMNDPSVKQIYAKALGDLILSYMDAQGWPPLPHTVEIRALETISSIKAVLDDKTLDDGDSCGQIKAIVTEYYHTALYTSCPD